MLRIQAADSVLLLIDWQTRLLPALPYGEAALANSCRLAEAAGLLSVPILITEHCADKLGATDERLLGVCAGADVLPKRAFSALGDPGLAEALVRHGGGRQCVVAGAEAHVCVLQTVLDLLEHGCAVFVVTDALASRQTADYRAALERMQQVGAVIVTTEMVLFEWQARADSPTMKAMLKLVR